MSVLVFAETWEGQFKKSTFEAVSYAADIASKKSTITTAVVFGSPANAGDLAKYGAEKIVVVTGLSEFNANAFAKTLSDIAASESADIIVVSATNNGKMVAPALSIYTEAGLITNASALPSNLAPFTVRRSAFSSKGLVDYTTDATKVVVSIVPNAIGVHENAASGNVSETASNHQANTAIQNVDRVKGKIPLPEAELVVSAGRGMKAPENWNLIEELAEVLGAGTACSKPVSDLGWRPHSEHVGQTGIQINPNLYIAVGISGAIQHLAGVSNSKTIVVINSDAEAPFFKAADYGIVGDAFEVVPKLTEAIRSFKAGH